MVSKISLQSQDKVAETLLPALYARAVEARLPEPLLFDESAVRMAEQIDYDFSRLDMGEFDRTNTILRVREFDRHARDFLAAHPQSVVVNIGCGLDTRFERVDNGQVEWYDLDLPEVIEFRQKLVSIAERRHMLGHSIFNQAWVEIVKQPGRHDYLFLAEGVLVYFTEAQVKSLYLRLMEEFPGCELVTDGMSPFMLWMHNLRLIFSKLEARLQWSLKYGGEPESWHPGIRLLSEWFYFDRSEPRLGSSQLMRYIPFFAKGVGIYHYRLGDIPG